MGGGSLLSRTLTNLFCCAPLSLVLPSRRLISHIWLCAPDKSHERGKCSHGNVAAVALCKAETSVNITGAAVSLEVMFVLVDSGQARPGDSQPGSRAPYYIGHPAEDRHGSRSDDRWADGRQYSQDSHDRQGIALLACWQVKAGIYFSHHTFELYMLVHIAELHCGTAESAHEQSIRHTYTGASSPVATCYLCTTSAVPNTAVSAVMHWHSGLQYTGKAATVKTFCAALILDSVANGSA